MRGCPLLLLLLLLLLCLSGCVVCLLHQSQ
jgi:hypothetical protein